MTLFKGSGVALVTPFKKTKNNKIIIDYDRLKYLVEFHIKNKTDSIVICGTTGEASSMSTKEHIKCIKKCVKYVNGRIPVIAGTGSNNTEKAIYMAKKAEKVGADCLLCVTPYYNKTNQEGLKLYYKRISDSVHIPIIMYNVPSRTGLNILPETAIDIANNNENIIGIKEASGDLNQIKILTESKSLDVYSGNDDQIYDVLALGGIGVISVLANILPQYTHEMNYAYFEGNIDKSKNMQKKALNLINALFSDVNPIPVKKACELKEICSGLIREPLIELDKEKEKTLKKELNKFKNEL